MGENKITRGNKSAKDAELQSFQLGLNFPSAGKLLGMLGKEESSPNIIMSSTKLSKNYCSVCLSLKISSKFSPKSINGMCLDYVTSAFNDR